MRGSLSFSHKKKSFNELNYSTQGIESCGVGSRDPLSSQKTREISSYLENLFTLNDPNADVIKVEDC